MSRLTKIDAQREIGRLIAAGHRLPEKLTTEALAEAWVEHLDGVWHEDVSAAVTGYIRGPDSRWPAVGKILGLAIEARKARPRTPGRIRPLAEEYAAWEQHVHTHEPALGLAPPEPNMGWPTCRACHDGCPVCGAREVWCPRLVVVHNEAEHEHAGIRWSGSCRAHQEFYAEADRQREQLARAQRIRTAEAEDRERQAAVERQRVAQKISPMLLEAAKLETQEVGI